MEVPRLGVHSELLLPTYTTATATWDPSQDRFYKVLTPEQKAKALKGQYNFDHPGRERPQG